MTYSAEIKFILLVKKVLTIVSHFFFAVDFRRWKKTDMARVMRCLIEWNF